MVQGVLFDMDGVLVDSEEYICLAAIEMFKRNGLQVSASDFIPFVGKGEDAYLGGVAEKYTLTVNLAEIKKQTYAIYEEMVEGKLLPLPGVDEFIKIAKNKGLKLALATSADFIKMTINLRNIGLSEKTFDATVNGLEVKNKKPFPDIFLLAAQKLRLDASNCLVVEDAVSGVEAAKKAGSKCLGLTTSFSKDELYKADWHASDLANAPLACLEW